MRTPADWPASDQTRRRLEPKLAGAEHYNFRFPWREPSLVFTRGAGVRLFDIDGNDFLDFFSGFGAIILGHAHPEYVEAVQDWTARLSAVPHTVLDEQVTDLLITKIPCAESVRFAVTGTEAVLLALRLARAFTGRNRVVRFVGHYHGHADAILGGRPRSMTDPTPVEFDGDPRGTDGRARGVLADQSWLLPWNDLDAVRGVFESNGDDICAVITEPISFYGGGIVPVPGFLEGLREICSRQGAVLVFDEVVTGFRVGIGGAQALLGVTPDLAVFGKAMGGGLLPVAAVVGRRDIMNQLADQRVAHGGTFNGYHLGLAATKACIDLLAVDGARPLAEMHLRGKEMMSRIAAAANEASVPCVVQGHPGCFAYHLTDRPLASVFDWTREIQLRDIAMRETLVEHAILTAPIGRFYPTIAISDDDVEEFGRRVKGAFKAFASAGRRAD